MAEHQNAEMCSVRREQATPARERRENRHVCLPRLVGPLSPPSAHNASLPSSFLQCNGGEDYSMAVLICLKVHCSATYANSLRRGLVKVHCNKSATRSITREPTMQPQCGEGRLGGVELELAATAWFRATCRSAKCSVISKASV